MTIEAPARALARALGIALFTAATAASFVPTAALASTANHHACSNDDQEAPQYQVTNVDVQHISGLRKKTMTVQAGPDPLDRFFVHRVSRADPAHPLRGVILVLPPLGSGFQNYEVSEDGDYAGSFVGFFASRGYDVWGYSQRVQGISSGSCESGALDCSAMAEWGLQTIVDDVTFIRRRIAQARPFAKVAIGGLSLGSMASVAIINAHPHAYAGAFLLEGTVHDTDTVSRSINQGFCDSFDDLLAGGVSYDGQQLPGVKLINALASSDPHGLSPLPGTPPGYTNHQVLVSVLSTAVISPTTPRPGYFLLAGDAEADQLTFANDALVRANLSGFVDYVALRTVRDVNCSLAGERTWSNNLHAFRGALFVAAGGHGFGTAMLDTAGLMPHANVTTSYLEPFGHIDHFFAQNHRELVEEPLLEWLEDEVFDR